MINVAVVGATGAVGREVVNMLERRRLLPVDTLRLFASERSAGQSIEFRGKSIKVEVLDQDSFDGSNIAIFSAGSETSRQFARFAVRHKCTVIDNSSAFRMYPDVPLVVPEINGDVLYKNESYIIANPNCTTAITLMALAPLHDRFSLKRISATSFQAVSGAGARGVGELNRQIWAISNNLPLEPAVFPHQIAYNVIPHIDAFLPNGYTKEEWKMQEEGAKILDHPTFKASATCVRVPVERAHTISVLAQFEEPITAHEARECLKLALGIKVADDPYKNKYPMPIHASRRGDCFVGRIRDDNAFENAISFVVSGDQLLKGAALNAVQIAELLVQ